jgi:hypothetical protein
MNTATPLLSLCIEALGNDVDRLLAPDPLALQASTLPGTRAVTEIKYDARKPFRDEDDPTLKVRCGSGEPEGNIILVGAILRDWILQYPIEVVSFRWTAREELGSKPLRPIDDADEAESFDPFRKLANRGKDWIEIGRFLRDFDEMRATHSEDFPGVADAPRGALVRFVLGERELSKELRAADAKNPLDWNAAERITAPNVLDVFSLCWGMRSTGSGHGSLELIIRIPSSSQRSAHERMATKAAWLRLSR